MELGHFENWSMNTISKKLLNLHNVGKYSQFTIGFSIVKYPDFNGFRRFSCAPHVFWSLRTPARTQFRTRGVLIMRNFSKRADRVTHRELPSGSVPEQGRRSYSCNLGLEPENPRNCSRSCAEVVQNRIQMSDVRLSVWPHFNILIKFNCS